MSWRKSQADNGHASARCLKAADFQVVPYKSSNPINDRQNSDGQNNNGVHLLACPVKRSSSAAEACTSANKPKTVIGCRSLEVHASSTMVPSNSVAEMHRSMSTVPEKPISEKHMENTPEHNESSTSDVMTWRSIA
ncbi:hypothetical protein AAVH_23052 [Aphelenchoides avenae]|nr:hypothetical protein AAVH_23052 [Aphelenchus avenae]